MDLLNRAENSYSDLTKQTVDLAAFLQEKVLFL